MPIHWRSSNASWQIGCNQWNDSIHPAIHWPSTRYNGHIIWSSRQKVGGFGCGAGSMHQQHMVHASTKHSSFVCSAEAGPCLFGHAHHLLMIHHHHQQIPYNQLLYKPIDPPPPTWAASSYRSKVVHKSGSALKHSWWCSEICYHHQPQHPKWWQLHLTACKFVQHLNPKPMQRWYQVPSLWFTFSPRSSSSIIVAALLFGLQQRFSPLFCTQHRSLLLATH